MMQPPDTKPGFYYVSVYRCNNNAGIGGQLRLLRGPFINDHAGAIAAVADTRKSACALDARLDWDSFGTVRCDTNQGIGALDMYTQKRKLETYAAPIVGNKREWNIVTETGGRLERFDGTKRDADKRAAKLHDERLK